MFFLNYFGCSEFEKILSKLNFEIQVVRNKNKNGRRYNLMYSIMQSDKILDSNSSGVFLHMASLEKVLWYLFKGNKILLHKTPNLQKYKMAAIWFANYHNMPYNFGQSKDRKMKKPWKYQNCIDNTTQSHL